MVWKEKGQSDISEDDMKFQKLEDPEKKSGISRLCPVKLQTISTAVRLKLDRRLGNPFPIWLKCHYE